MATKPTRSQQHACDLLTSALLQVVEAARADGSARLDGPALADLLAGMARASSAFGPDVIVHRALASRARALGLRSDTVDLLLLMDTEAPPSDRLLLDDDAFRGLVARLEEELGE